MELLLFSPDSAELFRLKSSSWWMFLSPFILISVAMSTIARNVSVFIVLGLLVVFRSCISTFLSVTVESVCAVHIVPSPLSKSGLTMTSVPSDISPSVINDSMDSEFGGSITG